MQRNEEYCEMGKVIKISAGGLEVEAELNDSSTAEAITKPTTVTCISGCA